MLRKKFMKTGVFIIWNRREIWASWFSIIFESTKGRDELENAQDWHLPTTYSDRRTTHKDARASNKRRNEDAVDPGYVESLHVADSLNIPLEILCRSAAPLFACILSPTVTLRVSNAAPQVPLRVLFF